MENKRVEFDEPALKQALKRAMGAEMAPLPLATRVQNALVAERGLQPAHRAGRHARPRIWSLAAAACLCLFSVSLMASQVWHTFSPRERLAVRSFDIPTDIAQELVARHDSCSSQPDQHYLPGVAKNDLVAIRKTLNKVLDQSALVIDLPDGWILRGASLCPVGNERAAHLLFTRGNQTLSLFSLPNADYPVSNADMPYEAISAGHPIAGFTHGNGLYCLVGYSPDGQLKLNEIKSLRDQLEDTAVFVLGTNHPQATITVAAR